MITKLLDNGRDAENGVCEHCIVQETLTSPHWIGRNSFVRQSDQNKM